MTSIQIVALSAVLAVFIAYPIVMRALAVRAQPMRLGMGKIGKDLLLSKHLNDQQKHVIKNMLADAYAWQPMAAFCLFLPFYIAKRVFTRTLPELPKIRDEKTKKNFGHFMGMHVLSCAIANPLGALIGALEFIILFLVLFFIALSRRAMQWSLRALIPQLKEISLAVASGLERRVHQH